MTVDKTSQEVFRELAENYEALVREWKAMSLRVVGPTLPLELVLGPGDLTEAWKWVLEHFQLSAWKQEKKP
jgi:hypothetical protein